MKRLLLAHAALASGLCPACADDMPPCTLELRTAVALKVTSRDDVGTVDRVTVEHGGKVSECQPGTALSGPNTVGGYSCWEQGGGEYVVRVYSGSLVWTRKGTATETADGCHVEEPIEIDLVLTEETADP